MSCRGLANQQFLNAGPGFGGSCFPKDARALVKTGDDDHGAPMRIIETVLASDEWRKRAMAGKIRAASGGGLAEKNIALLGLTFKAGTDDMRDAPSIVLAQALVEDGASVHAYDPVGTDRARPLLAEGVRHHPTAFGAADRADAIVLVTEWERVSLLGLRTLKARNDRTVAGRLAEYVF
jgi:UDPglucose 6-dehydrogenase